MSSPHRRQMHRAGAYCAVRVRVADAWKASRAAVVRLLVANSSSGASFVADRSARARLLFLCHHSCRHRLIESWGGTWPDRTRMQFPRNGSLAIMFAGSLLLATDASLFLVSRWSRDVQLCAVGVSRWWVPLRPRLVSWVLLGWVHAVFSQGSGHCAVRWMDWLISLKRTDPSACKLTGSLLDPSSPPPQSAFSCATR